MRELSVKLDSYDIERDDWMAIAFKPAWYIGQFIEKDEKEDVYKFHFVEKSSMAHLFVWPEVSGKIPDTSWVEKGNVSSSQVKIYSSYNWENNYH